MPLFERPGAALYYEETGRGPPILANHGVAENRLYWTLPGVAARLADAGFRVILTDLRGHGRSEVTGPDRGFDVETLAADIGALADHLGLERFHLLTHATGGMAGVRYAMAAHPRLLSLLATNTGAATLPSDAAADITDAAEPAPRIRPGPNRMAQGFRGRPWVQIVRGAREGARRDPFLNSLHRAVDPKAAFAWYEACVREGDPDILADFMDAFYDDANPYIARLRAITCPTLALVGAHDVTFLRPSMQLAREIPDARLVVAEGRGHMLAFEDPEATAGALLGFLRG